MNGNSKLISHETVKTLDKKKVATSNFEVVQSDSVKTHAAYSSNHENRRYHRKHRRRRKPRPSHNRAIGENNGIPT